MVRHIKYCALLIVSVLLTFFQLTTFKFATKWDNFSAFLAYKYTASHWWNNGFIPLWDPYQNLGYPMHANPQSGIFYPLTWLLGLNGGYGIYSLNIEVLFHFCLAGVGIYILCTYLKHSSIVALTAGLTYSLSGFVFGSSHMLGFTTAAAWLPLCIFILLRILKNPNLTNLCLFILIHYMQITGAYMAFSIILFYIEMGIIFHYFSHNRFNKKTLSFLMYAGIITLVSLSPFLYSVFDSFHYTLRSEGLDYNSATLGGNFNANCLLSLLAPYVNSSASGFDGIDVSLSNIYIGIGFLILLVGYILFSKHTKKWLYISLMALSILLALGINTPIHKLFFNWVPGLNVFRHPYIYSLYFVFIAVLSASHFWEFDFKENINKIKKASLVFGAAFLVFTIVGLINTNFEVWPEYLESLRVKSENSPLNDFGHLWIQSVISIILVIGLHFSLNSKNGSSQS